MSPVALYPLSYPQIQDHTGVKRPSVGRTRRAVVGAVREADLMPVVIVYPPDEQGGRRVRIDGEIAGRAFDLGDVVEFLRRAGLEGVDDTDVVRANWIEWRGGGPLVWEH